VTPLQFLTLVLQFPRSGSPLLRWSSVPVDLNNFTVAREVSDMFNGVANAGYWRLVQGRSLASQLFFFPPKRGIPTHLGSASAKVIFIL